MMIKLLKIKFIAAIALAAFLGTAVIGLIFMMDSDMKMDQNMADECPYALVGDKVCPQSAFGSVVHQISLYQLFTNAPINFGLAAFIFSLFLIAGAILAVFINSALSAPPAITGISCNFPPGASYKRKISRWLSLHENSPAIA